MTLVSDNPTWWPFISSSALVNYFVAASSTVVVYDWALTFGQEFELILVSKVIYQNDAVDLGQRKRWSFMTVLYICVRYIGILFSAINILWTWTPVIINAMLGVTMIARINAMYLGSKKLLIFLVVTLLACTITSGVIVVVENLGVSTQEAVLSGFHICINYTVDTYTTNLTYESMISIAVWEILALFLTVWIVIKRFHELQQLPTGSTIGHRFTMLTHSHVFYFLAFAIVASLRLGLLSPSIRDSLSMGSDIYSGIWAIAEVLQMFVLGPRLILSIREYHTKLVARANGEIGMTPISTF
ncbi:hypothetical protein F4604DRAFT_1918070 [Suillus subluteus]|nr:hypothetical protein F4604DRAFT_1918070 [Suillus subluteus]